MTKTYFKGLQKGAVFKDPSGRYKGTLWLFEGEIKDGKGEIAGKRLMTVFDDGKVVKEVNPALIWDLVPVKKSKPKSVDLRKDKAQTYPHQAWRLDLLESHLRNFCTQ